MKWEEKETKKQVQVQKIIHKKRLQYFIGRGLKSIIALCCDKNDSIKSISRPELCVSVDFLLQWLHWSDPVFTSGSIADPRQTDEVTGGRVWHAVTLSPARRHRRQGVANATPSSGMSSQRCMWFANSLSTESSPMLNQEQLHEIKLTEK